MVKVIPQVSKNTGHTLHYGSPQPLISLLRPNEALLGKNLNIWSAII